MQLLPWELTSPAALETRGDAARDADLLSYAGVIIRRNAVCRDAVATCRLRAEELATEATRRAAAAGADAGDASAGFHFADASQRGPFRLDLRLGAAFTRLQTKTLQGQFEGLDACGPRLEPRG